MLIFDFIQIGNKLHSIRKRMGLTQADVAEAAGLADRTYADIERGSVNMRIETILRICNVLHITPDEILTEDSPSPTSRQDELCTGKLIAIAKEKKLDYVVDVFPHYSSDVTAALRGGNNICGALIGPGVQASHNIERTHRLGLENTLELLKGYLEV